MQPGYALGGRVNLEDYKARSRPQEEDEQGFGQRRSIAGRMPEPVRPGPAAPVVDANYRRVHANRPRPEDYDDHDMYRIAHEQCRTKRPIPTTTS